ncbi:glycosyltransferase family 39 protein [Pendulispora brunnea]|uniref:Glycosyltransferase family 39 protein n=1 Tax=Pendulispora brunnea TaxID=2905690 RepID=A0ABZ2JWZ1_9BACT
MKRPWHAALAASAVALGVRLAVVAWAWRIFPPSADGTYYHKLAVRLAEGHGYTWLWPDGAVTYAAHYPVGYPALMALGYALFGVHPVVAMVQNALLGAAMAWATHVLVEPIVSRGVHPRAPFLAALGVGLHPALVPYTAALMTEGTTTALLTVAAAFASRARGVSAPRRVVPWLLAAGITMGIATLVRPQSLVLAPALGVLALARSFSWRARAAAAGAVLGVTLLCCAPWTLRNCMHMHRCALVSVNAGWNMFIGEETRSGAWEEARFPEECSTVWDEAEKDVCLERVARRRIREAPAAWFAKMPRKLAVTLDYFGAAPWYLRTANASAFSERAKLALGTVETVVSRLLLVFALAALAFRPGPRRNLRRLTGLLGVALALSPVGWLAYLVLALLAAEAALAEPAGAVLFGWTAAVIAATAATHAVFFGAGRYGLVVVPFVTALAALNLRRVSRC